MSDPSVTGTLVRSVRRVKMPKSRAGYGGVPAFRNEAECGGCEPDLFYPNGGYALDVQAAVKAQSEAAKALCRRCPVREPCLEWALSVPEKFGIWGGMTEDERSDVLKGMAPGSGKKQRRAAKNGAKASGKTEPAKAAQSGTAAGEQA